MDLNNLEIVSWASRVNITVNRIKQTDKIIRGNIVQREYTNHHPHKLFLDLQASKYHDT